MKYFIGSYLVRLALLVAIFSGTAEAQCKPRLVIQPNEHGGQATFDRLGQSVVIIDPKLYWNSPAYVRDFVYYHELAHIILGHVTRANAGQGFLDPSLSRAHEAAADDYSSRVIFAKGMSNDLNLIADWIAIHLTQDEMHPLPQWRAVQIKETVRKLTQQFTGDDPAASALVVIDTPDIHWNESGCPPAVSLRMTFTNTGGRPVKCEGMIASGSVPSDAASGDRSNWAPFDTKIISFALQPGERSEEQDQLTWFRDVAGKMPSLATPGDLPGLMACKFTGGAPNNDLLTGILNILQDVPHQFENLRGASDEAIPQWYYSKLLLPGATHTHISDVDQFWEYDATLFDNYSSRLQANQKLTQVVKLLQASLPEGWKVDTSVWFGARSAAGYINIGTVPSKNGSYSVTLAVTSKK